MQVEVFAINRKVIWSGTIISKNKGEEKVVIRSDDNEEVSFYLKFADDEKSNGQRVDFTIADDQRSAVMIFNNFNSTLGSVVHDANVAAVDGKDIYFDVSIQLLNKENDTRLIHLSVSKEI